MNVGVVKHQSFEIDWLINDFMARNEKILMSKDIDMWDTKWTLSIYPHSTENFENVSFYLKKGKCCVKIHHVEVSLGIKEANGTVYKSRTFEHHMNGVCSRGYEKYITRSELVEKEDILYPRNDLTFTCKVRLLTNYSVETFSQTAQPTENKDYVLKISEESENEEEGNTDPDAEGKKCPHIARGVQFGRVIKSLKSCHNILICNGCSNEVSVEELPEVWLCLQCGYLGCGRMSENKHALQHFKTIHSDSHSVVLSTTSGSVWCYECDDEVNVQASNVLKQCVDFVMKLPLSSNSPNVKKNEGSHSEGIIAEVENKEPIKKNKYFSSQDVNTLIENLENLFEKEQNSDVKVKVGQREFNAHKSILTARSPVLATMFEHDMVEKQNGIINVEECDSDAFKDFLQYLYAANVDDLSTEKALDLYSIAHKYDVSQLVRLCLNFLIENISVDTFSDVLSLALKYNEAALIKAAEEFFANNIKSIVVTVKWQTFVKENGIIGNELLIKFLNKA